MNEKAQGYVLIFSLYAIFGRMFYRWYLYSIYESAGKNPSEVAQFKYLRRRLKLPLKPVFKWLIEESPEPEKTRKMIIKYYLFNLPIIILLILSIIGLRSHTFDSLLDNCSVFMPLYLMFLLLMCMIRWKRR